MYICIASQFPGAQNAFFVRAAKKTPCWLRSYFLTTDSYSGYSVALPILNSVLVLTFGLLASLSVLNTYLSMELSSGRG